MKYIVNLIKFENHILDNQFIEKIVDILKKEFNGLCFICYWIYINENIEDKE